MKENELDKVEFINIGTWSRDDIRYDALTNFTVTEIKSDEVVWLGKNQILWLKFKNF